ncbi:MAG: sulfoxide reductase heme-binding subunit YedZ [Deltaproteobacteria bacterium]|jgi:sulfoxide reductase heme-binding subunit YedZ|nr:sulfoxide reductase heme-binding subunit YedZ [Deltaproteobacteria bacterium]
MNPERRKRALQFFAIAAAVLPAAQLIASALTGGLGANPVEKITHVTGDWALRFLLLSLSVTPLRRLFGWHWVVPLRRTLGLTAFGYACCHFFTFLALDHFFDWRSIVEDVLERRYVTAGFSAFLCLVPLAATSTRAMMRRLGRRWVPLHRLAYLAAALGVVHFLWLVKSDLREPLLYAAALALLLGLRIGFWLARSRSRNASPKEPKSRPSGA